MEILGCIAIIRISEIGLSLTWSIHHQLTTKWEFEHIGKNSSKYFPKAETFPLQTHLHSAILNIIRIFITKPFLQMQGPAYPH